MYVLNICIVVDTVMLLHSFAVSTQMLPCMFLHPSKFFLLCLTKRAAHLFMDCLVNYARKLHSAVFYLLLRTHAVSTLTRASFAAAIFADLYLWATKQLQFMKWRPFPKIGRQSRDETEIPMEKCQSAISLGANVRHFEGQ